MGFTKTEQYPNTPERGSNTSFKKWPRSYLRGSVWAQYWQKLRYSLYICSWLLKIHPGTFSLTKRIHLVGPFPGGWEGQALVTRIPLGDSGWSSFMGRAHRGSTATLVYPGQVFLPGLEAWLVKAQVKWE